MINSNNILYQDSIPFFTTILDLRAFNNYDQGSIVEVGGRNSIGDGYGSKFIYDSTNTQADDGEYVIRPDNIAANGSGRWLINGWGYLDDKMNANNKFLSGMTIQSSTITGSVIDNTTIKGGVSVDPTTDWTTNTVVGALDISNKFETQDNANTSYNNLQSSLTTEYKAYTDNSVNNMGALKANLAGGNTLTGNQVINGGLSVTNSGGTIYGNTTGSSKWYISRNDGQKCTIINSYNGSWKYLSIEDDGTIQCNNGTLALQSAVDTKANLSGGNNLTGDQSISGGSLKVLGSDNSYTGILKDAEATEKGAIVRYNDGTTNHDWVLGTDSITAPNGEAISTSGNYATQDWTRTNYVMNGDVGDPRGLGVQAAVIDANSLSPSFLDSGGNWHVCQPIGNYARTDAINAFSNDQNFAGYLNVSNGKALVTNSLDNTIRAFRYVDNNGAATTDLDRASDGANLSWFRLYQDGMLRSSKGDVVFRNDVDWGPINGGTYTRLGNVLTQAFLANSNGSRQINYPIAYSQVPTVTITIHRDGQPNFNNNQIVNITNTGFWYAGTDTGDLSVMVMGEY